MYLLATAALIFYPLFVVATFLFTTPARAVFISYLVAWLYLPLITIDIPGLPNYGKFTAASIVILPCLFLFALSRIAAIRFHVADIAALVWVVVPLASSLSNGLGAYDGFSGVVNHFLTYGIPYIAGKASLQHPKDWADFQRLMIVAGLSYAPLAIYETRMSPSLHLLVYGVPGRSAWEYSSMFGPFGWQPTVFMNSAFEVAMMFVICTLIAPVTKKETLPPWVAACHAKLTWAFAIMVLLCKKWSAFGLVGVGLLGLKARSRSTLLLVLSLPVLYMAIFVSGVYRGEGLTEKIALISERRSESMETRITNDNRLVQKAMERPVLGWGGWGRNRVYNEDGQDVSITDSLWMIYLGLYGLIGLSSQTALFALPAIGFALRYNPKTLSSVNAFNRIGYVASIVLGLHMIDNLFNGFPNSVFPLIAGGLTLMVGASDRALAMTITN